MPRAPRGKRVYGDNGEFVVVGRATRGNAQPYFDKKRQVWVAPWRKPDGRVGKPTGRTRADAEASRDRHIASAQAGGDDRPIEEGFHHGSTVAELSRWWLDNIARHRVRVTTWQTYDKQLRLVIDSKLGALPVQQVRPEHVATFVGQLAERGSPSRARNVRVLLAQVLDEGVNLGLADQNAAKKVRSPRVPKKSRRVLTPDESRRLIEACDERYSAAIALCFVQGWRVSEALGLAWQDLDLDAGTVHLRRGATYADGIGMVLGPPKTQRTGGRQLLGATVVAQLRRRRSLQDDDRKRLGEAWPTLEHNGEHLDLVFTNAVGQPVMRQHIDRALRKAAAQVGLDPRQIGTHDGRRSVVTNLYASGNFDLNDVARFVGHSDVATTRGYIQTEGERPTIVSQKALELLDPSL